MSYNGFLFTENEYRQSTKTEEELKKLTLEEDLGELKRSFHILTKGQHLQKWAIYSNLHNILKEADAPIKLLPIIYEDIQNQDEDIQIEGGKSINKAIINKPVLDCWVQVFKELIELLQQSSKVEEDSNKIILFLSDPSQPTVSRYIAGKMIGYLVQIRKDRIKGPLFDRARQLSVDHDFDVRKLMASEVLLKICQNINAEYIEIYVLEKALELVYDAEINVKCAGIRLIFEIAVFLSPEEQKGRICKIFIELIGSTNEEVFKTMSSICGKAFNTLHVHIMKNPTQLNTLLTTFKEYANHKNEEIRKNFAYNLPGMIKLTDIKTFDRVRPQYLNMIQKDSSKEVRLILCASLHEIAQLLGPEEAYKTIGPVFKAILKDKDLDLPKKLIPNLDVLLQSMKQPETEQSDSDEEENGKTNEDKQEQQEDFLKDIVEFYKTIQKGNDWRLKIEFLKRMQNCLENFDLQEFYETIVQCALQQMKASPNELKSVSCILVVKFMKINYLLFNTKAIMDKMLEEFKGSSNYADRITFIDFCSHMQQNFSRSFCRENKLLSGLDLVTDKVPNMRIKLAKSLLYFRCMIDDDDEEQEEALNNIEKIINKLLNNLDKDVKEATLQGSHRIKQANLYDESVSKEIKMKDQECMKNEENLQLLYKDFEKKEKKDNEDLDVDYHAEFLSLDFKKYMPYAKKRFKAKHLSMQSQLSFGSSNFGAKKKTAIKSYSITPQLTSDKDRMQNSKKKMEKNYSFTGKRPSMDLKRSPNNTEGKTNSTGNIPTISVEKVGNGTTTTPSTFVKPFNNDLLLGGAGSSKERNSSLEKKVSLIPSNKTTLQTSQFSQQAAVVKKNSIIPISKAANLSD